MDSDRECCRQNGSGYVTLHDKNYLQISLDISFYIKRKLRSRNGFSVTINSDRTNLEKD